jgi:hypothetical protein
VRRHSLYRRHQQDSKFDDRVHRRSKTIATYRRHVVLQLISSCYRLSLLLTVESRMPE